MDLRQGFTVEGDASLADCAALAVDHDFDFLELNMDYAFAPRRVDPAAVREVAEAHDLDLLVHLPYRVDPGSAYREARAGAVDTLERAIDVAVECDAERGVVHGVAMARPEKWDHDLVQGWILETLAAVSTYGRERGFEVVVENLKSPFFDAGDFPSLFDETDCLGCLDTGHALVTGHDGAVQADLLREHGDRITHIHLNESRRTDEDEHLPVGIGRIDFGAIAAALVETGWTGTVNHEVYQLDREYLALGKDRFDALLAEAA